jgi:hypothetical protein
MTGGRHYIKHWSVDMKKSLLSFSSMVQTRPPGTTMGKTPLHWASLKGHTRATRALLDRGADTTAQDKGGRTPLHLALRMDMKKSLLSFSSMVRTRPPGTFMGKLPLHWASLRDTCELLAPFSTAVQIRRLRTRTGGRHCIKHYGMDMKKSLLSFSSMVRTRQPGTTKGNPFALGVIKGTHASYSRPSRPRCRYGSSGQGREDAIASSTIVWT